MTSSPHLLVAGGYRGIPLAPQNGTWQVTLLHPDPLAQADICQDFTVLAQRPTASYDQIWCVQYLQCHYRHEIPQIMAHFWRLLKPNGELWLRVPDAYRAIEKMVHEQLEPDMPLFDTPHGTWRIHDVIYGHNAQLQANRHPFYPYKHGFSKQSLEKLLLHHQFQIIESGALPTFEIQVQARKVSAAVLSSVP